MGEVRITRDFPVTPERLFRAVTQRAEVLEWWGHDGMTLPDTALDFTREGPWHSEMRDADGNRYRMSGQVTHVDPPHSVGFTWTWHLPEGMRAPESHVTFTVTPAAGGARLTIDHRDLPDDDRAARHETGWTSGPMVRLARHLQTHPH
ncbi:SRPBCC family protein [Roseovarius sp.]|uniref:SRPBCC family protein n=1 Tax=Roseovarius sp. TaxID=1486281 RepID=UPI003B5B0EB5